MGSETQHKIPVINFSKDNLKPRSESWILASKQVRNGFEENGSFEINYEKFPMELHNSVFDAAKDLFDLPKETKMKNTSLRSGTLGYIAPGPWASLYESMLMDSPTTLEGAEYFSNIMWPQGNDNFLYVLFDVLPCDLCFFFFSFCID